jgi:multiple sugar transport system ATP-binding protein
VAIGRAIVREPAVFLFDEPLSNLDAALRINTRIEIAKLHRSLKATTIYVTHDQVEAMTLASKIVVINHGRIEQIGAPLDVYHRPANLFVAGFIGSPKMNFVAGKVSGRDGGVAVTLDVGGGATVPMADAPALGDTVTLGVRPEHLTEGEGEGLRLSAEVDAVEHLGESSLIHTHLDDGTVVVARTPGDSPTVPGTRVILTAPVSALHVFAESGKALGRG